MVYNFPARCTNLYTAMFVRWQSRERSRAQFGKWGEPDTHWRAILVENARVDGKSRKRHIAYLVGFTESRGKIPTQRCYLWDAITAKLDHLGNQITPEERAKIELSIAAKLPRPTPAEYLECARSCAATFGWDFLEEGFRAVLADEADRWQGREGESATRIRNAFAAAKSATATSETVRCSFCGRTNDQVQVMVAGHGVAICDECVDTAAARIREKKATATEP
jgi:ClpX C4-type zinc finger